MYLSTNDTSASERLEWQYKTCIMRAILVIAIVGFMLASIAENIKPMPSQKLVTSGTSTKQKGANELYDPTMALLDSALNSFGGKKLVNLDSNFAYEWLGKNVHYLCDIKILFIINVKHQKMRNEFCEQLEKGKNIEEAAKKVYDSTKNIGLNTLPSFDKDIIRHNIQQISILGNENKEMLKTLVVDRSMRAIGLLSNVMPKVKELLNHQNVVMVKSRRRRRAAGDNNENQSNVAKSSKRRLITLMIGALISAGCLAGAINHFSNDGNLVVNFANAESAHNNYPRRILKSSGRPRGSRTPSSSSGGSRGYSGGYGTSGSHGISGGHTHSDDCYLHDHNDCHHHHHNSLSRGAIRGISGGGAALIILIAICLCICKFCDLSSSD